jgi:hypothetical protein
LQLFVDDFSKAEYWYQRCTAFDPERVDCPIFLARLYYDYKQHSKVPFGLTWIIIWRPDWGSAFRVSNHRSLGVVGPMPTVALCEHACVLVCQAWDECVKALSSTYPIRAFGNNFYIYDCFTPVEAAKTLNALMQVRHTSPHTSAQLCISASGLLLASRLRPALGTGSSVPRVCMAGGGLRRRPLHAGVASAGVRVGEV